MRTVMITTEDNPYDPLTHFDEWYQFDELKGYHTCSYLARITMSSDDLSDLDQTQAVEQAIDEILEFNLTGNYKKIVYDD